MKKITAIITAALVALFASAAFAKPSVSEFRDKQFPITSLKTVLVMPVGYEITVPESEAFLVEAAEQKWKDFTLNKKERFPFVMRTPQEVIDRAVFITGEQPEPMTPTQLAHKAYNLAPDHVDAVLMCTVTKCAVGKIHHPEEYVTKYRYEDRPVWRNNRWETERVQVPYEEYKRVGRERLYGRGQDRAARREGRTPHLRRDRLREHRRGPLQRSAVSDEAHPERNRKRRETNSGEVKNGGETRSRRRVAGAYEGSLYASRRTRMRHLVLARKERELYDVLQRRFIGGLFGGELCLVYTEAAAELLGRPEPVYRGYSSEALHRMLPVPLDMAKEALRLTKLETLSWKEYVYDIAAAGVGARFWKISMTRISSF